VAGGFELRVGTRRRLDHLRRLQKRRRCRDRGELGGELAEAEVLGATLDEAEGGGVPEGRGSAVAERDLVPVRERQELGDSLAQATDDGLHSGLTVAGAQVGWSGGGEGSHRLLSNLRRPGAEAAVAGPKFGRQLDRGQRGSHRPTIGEITDGSEIDMAHARISQRVGSIEESATLAIDARAKALKAAGEDVIGFGAGEPDFPTDRKSVV